LIKLFFLKEKFGYRKVIEKILNDHCRSNSDGIESKLIIDRKGDHYQILILGWQGKKRIFFPLVHIDLIGEKIWIQHDGTEEGVAMDLVDEGIPKCDIVLGFHSRKAREYTDYAVE
jgi:hypothetical protein